MIVAYADTPKINVVYHDAESFLHFETTKHLRIGDFKVYRSEAHAFDRGDFSLDAKVEITPVASHITKQDKAQIIVNSYDPLAVQGVFPSDFFPQELDVTMYYAMQWYHSGSKIYPLAMTSEVDMFVKIAHERSCHPQSYKPAFDFPLVQPLNDPQMLEELERLQNSDDNVCILGKVHLTASKIVHRETDNIVRLNF